MFSSGEKKIVVDLSLENRERLLSAFIIASAIEDIKTKVIEGVFSELQGKLSWELGDEWYFEISADCSVKHGVFFYARKKKWDETDWYICVVAEEPGPKNLYYGVEKNPEEETINSLKEALNKTHLSSKEDNPYYIWWRWVEDRYCNWDDPNFFCNLHFDKEKRREILEYLKNELLAIAKIAEEHIDRIVQR